MKITQLMAVLNITPDSSYDQGRSFQTEVAIAQGMEMAKKGADWIDIGGESTRPNAAPVDEKEELRRVIPVIKALKKQIKTPLSIDTMKASVAEKAIEAGAQLINDVSGFRDYDMRRVAAHSGLPICAMHMLETPATMQNNPFYKEGIIPFLLAWFQNKIEELLAAGVKSHNIILDPGIGFGKTVADNVIILQNLHTIKDLGFPVLISLSRKSFMGKILNKHYPDLLAASLCANTLAIQQKVDIIRVHDVCEHRDLIDLLTFFDGVNIKGNSF